jgi:hypothetical protein
MLFTVIKWMIVSNTMVYRILAITLFANTITAIIIFFIGIFLNMNGFISGFSMTSELMVFVLKSSFSSGDNSFETRDKLSQYGDKLSFSRDVMLTGVTVVILLYLYYRSIIFVFLSILIFITRPFCKLVFIMLILLTNPFLSLGHFYLYM